MTDQLLQALRAIQHLNRLHNRRIGVINLSLGAYTWNNQPPPLVSQVIKELSADAVVVAAAGNNSRDRKFWPAAFDSVVGVGALTADGQNRTTFSNFGDWVDAWAPGQRVASSFVEFDGPEDEAPKADIDRDCFTGFATWSGTSFPAPHLRPPWRAGRRRRSRHRLRSGKRSSTSTASQKAQPQQGPVVSDDHYRDDVDSSDLADLVAGAAAGEQKSWNELVDRFAGLVWHVARSHRLGDADASDVAQTVWLRLVESLPRLREPAAVGGWLATTTRHECLRVLRVTGREVPDDSAAMVEIPSQDASPEASWSSPRTGTGPRRPRPVVRSLPHPPACTRLLPRRQLRRGLRGARHAGRQHRADPVALPPAPAPRACLRWRTGRGRGATVTDIDPATWSCSSRCARHSTSTTRSLNP